MPGRVLRTKEGKKNNSLVRAWKENAIEAIHRHSEFRFTAGRTSLFDGNGRG